jgi:D-alanyl-D-alanine carboxypeptidase
LKVLSSLVFSTILAIAILSGTPASAKYASMVIDADTGDVLHQINADTRNYPASLTKIMTLYMVFDALEKGTLTLDTPLKVSKRAAGMPPSKIGVKVGATIRVEDAILALVTKSANDVAVVVAEALGGTEIEFARIMTERARQIGMSRTSFRNASGLPNRRQLSTARDMALLGIRIREDFPGYYRYFSTQRFKYAGRSYKNHNSLLASYAGADGVKTGYIRASGFNLVAAAERDGRRVIGVVFGGKTSRSRDAHMKTLLDKGFEKLLERDAFREPLLALDGPASRSGVTVQPVPVVAQGDSDGDADAGGGADTVVVDSETQLLSAPASQVAAIDVQATRWSIQVGAFSRLEAARSVADQTAARLGALATGAVALVDSTGRFHRARLSGFDKGGAYRACQALRSNNIDCLVFAPRG